MSGVTLMLIDAACLTFFLVIPCSETEILVHRNSQEKRINYCAITMLIQQKQ
jgi:hypothetical protein